MRDRLHPSSFERVWTEGDLADQKWAGPGPLPAPAAPPFRSVHCMVFQWETSKIHKIFIDLKKRDHLQVHSLKSVRVNQFNYCNVSIVLESLDWFPSIPEYVKIYILNITQWASEIRTLRWESGRGGQLHWFGSRPIPGMNIFIDSTKSKGFPLSVIFPIFLWFAPQICFWMKFQGET